MGAPVFNTRFVGNGSFRQAKNPMATPKQGGLHDIYQKGQKLYGIGQQAYGAYQTFQTLRSRISKSPGPQISRQTARLSGFQILQIPR